MSVPVFQEPGIPKSSLDRVFQALQDQGHRPKHHGATHVQSRCPVHEDSNPSLSIDWVSDRGGMTKLHCHGCPADERELLEAVGLGLTDRFDQPLPPRDFTATPMRRRNSIATPPQRLGPLPKRLVPEPVDPRPVRTPQQNAGFYDYVDEAGVLLGQCVRVEWTEDGVPKKTFKQRHPDGNGGWIHKAASRRVLRHLPAVAEAITAQLPVWVTEGEKDDEALNKVLRGVGAPLGIATTNNNGAGGFAGEQIDQLRGAHVVLVVDRDAAGYRRAVDLSNRLVDVADSSRIVLSAVTTNKADAFDHLAAGFALDDFLDLSLDHAQTLVAGAEAIAEANRADQSAAKAQDALDESAARLIRAAEATKRNAPVAAADEARFALRWANEAVKHAKAAGSAAYHAQELVLAFDSRVAEFGLPPAELDCSDVLPRAEEAMSRAQRLAEDAWDACGAPMPAPIREVLVRAAPTFQPKPEQPSTDIDATVVQFPTGGGGGGDRRAGSPVRWPEYERLPTGVIVERRYDRDGRLTLNGVLSLDARVLRVECLENEPADDSDDAMAPDHPEEQRIVSYVVGYTHPVTAELVTLRVAGDRARSGDWLADLPQMGLNYDSSSRGRAKVWDAIRKTSADADVVTMYRSTGWRQVAGLGWTYIHAGGGITNGGSVALPVKLPGTLARVELPAPLSDGPAVRALFDRDSRSLMTRLMPHVGAVLAGTAYRAVLGWTGPATMVFGVPGSFKTGVTALAMQHFGVRWDRSAPGASMSGQGATLNAIREALWSAKDCLFFGDDFAPDKGVDAAATMLGQIARMQFNRENRERFDARNDTVKPGRGSRCTMILTSEVKAASASGQERVNVLDLAKGQLDLATILELDAAPSRRGRATVMASLLSWMAGDLVSLRRWAKGRAAELAEHRRNSGADARVAEPLAELEVGWELIGKFLVAIDAYRQDEADQMLVDVHAALTEAGERSLDPDSPSSVGERCRQMIASALRSGTIHLTYPGGVTPEYPEALLYGHRRVVTGRDPHTHQEEIRCEPRGEWAGAIVGTIHGRRMHVDPTTMLSAILTAARRAGEPLQAGRSVIQRELAAVGILRTIQAGPITRYTCNVTDPSHPAGEGAQTRLWDLDADAIFSDREPPAPPVQPTDPVGPDPYPGDDMPQITDDVQFDSGTPGPCLGCGQTTSLYIRVNGSATPPARMHLVCWKQLAAVPARADAAPCLGCGLVTTSRFGDQPLHPGCDIAAATAAVAPPTVPVPSASPQLVPEAAADIAPVGTNTVALPVAPANGRGRRVAKSEWAYSVAVIDPAGVYLPDGTIAAVDELHTVADIAAVGEQFRIGHSAGAGLLVLTSAMVEQLGLMPDAAALTVPLDNGEPAAEDDVTKRIQAHLADQTAFLSNVDGWTADGDKLGPWTRIRKDGRAFRLVLEPFAWVWDRRVDSRSPFMGLPDADTDPHACWQELARRLGRLSDLLGMPWSTSPGATGEAIFDQIQRHRTRNNGRVLTAAGTVPDLTPTTQVRLEGEFAWRRLMSAKELAAAAVIQKYDKRGSYLATTGGADLGYGDPNHLTAEQATTTIAASRADRKRKMPFGLWLVTLPAWDQPTPPPHPEQRTTDPVVRWVTTATLVLLLDDEEAGGAGYDIGELALAEAWVWPDQARFLEPWYTRCRDALLASRADCDEAVADAIKGLYTGYVGRMASRYTAGGARPWHHQPVWEATIRALARASLWRALQRHHLATGRLPIGIDHDEVGYLDTSTDPRVNPPAADNGRLGALKPSGTVLLTDTLRKQLAAGGSGLDKQLEHLDIGEQPATTGSGDQ